MYGLILGWLVKNLTFNLGRPRAFGFFVALVSVVPWNAEAQQDRPNKTLLQGFYWYIPNPSSKEEDYRLEKEPESDLWDYIAEKGADTFAKHGFTHVWLPPPSKAYHDVGEKGDGYAYNVGYAVYDRYDLGEFDQLGGIRTKYGTKERLTDAIDRLHRNGIKVLADVVFNHMLGTEHAVEIEHSQSFDRNGYSFGSGIGIAYLEFDFLNKSDRSPRGDTYSSFVWRPEHFDGMESYGTYYLFRGKTVDKVNNYGDLGGGRDYQYLRSDIILGADIDLEHPEAAAELTRWSKWLVDEIGYDGFRVDAIRHLHTPFVHDWAVEMSRHLRQVGKGSDALIFGENWDGWSDRLRAYLNGRPEGKSTYYAVDPNDYTGISRAMSLLDVPLHYDFQKISGSHPTEWLDISTLPGRGLLAQAPNETITFVDNHDTVPTEKLASYIPAHTKIQAYTYILLNEYGIPCVFYRDLYKGNFVSEYESNQLDYLQSNILKLIQLRHQFAYGPGQYYQEKSGLLGYRRYGTDRFPGGLVYIIRQQGATESSLTIPNVPESFRLVMGEGRRFGQTFELGKSSLFAVWAPSDLAD